MTTTINASTSAGLVQTADTSGALALQTAGTTALSISASQVVTLTNALPVASGGSGVTTSTGTGANVLGTSPTITTPTISGDATISGLTVGKGGGAVVTNTAVGANALNNNSTGTGVTAIGSSALLVNTASNNTAIGRVAGTSTTSGSDNTFLGMQSGYTNVTGVSNVYAGVSAGYTATGSYNTFVGQGSGETISSGAKNSILGRYNGNQGSLDIRTASNYIVLSDGDGNPRQIFNSNGDSSIGRNPVANIALSLTRGNTGDETLYAVNSASSGVTTSITTFAFSGYSPNNTSARFLYCGDTTAERCTIRSNGGIANYSANNVNLSDQREKKDIELAGSYLTKVCAIPVKTFLFNDQTDADLNLGVIAQDVQAVAPELVMESNWGTEEEPKMRLSIYQTDLQYALMKSIQELKAINDTQAETINALVTRIEALENRA